MGLNETRPDTYPKAALQTTKKVIGMLQDSFSEGRVYYARALVATVGVMAFFAALGNLF